MYGCETWSTTKLQCSRIDAFDLWALRKILRIPYTRHVTNVEVRATTGYHPLSHLVTWQTFAALWTYCPQLAIRGPPACCRCGDPGVASRLEATVRKTQPHLASCSGGRPWPTEHWPCICLEEGNYSWRLAANCGHGNAPAEFAIKEERTKNLLAG